MKKRRNEDDKPFNGKKSDGRKSSSKKKNDWTTVSKGNSKKFADKDEKKATDKRSDGSKRTFDKKRNEDRKKFDKKPEDKPSFEKSKDDRKPFEKRSEDKRSFEKRDGDRKPFARKGDEKRSFGKRNDDRKPFAKKGDDKRSFVKRDDDRKPFVKRDDDKRSFVKRDDDRKPFVKRDDEKRSFVKRDDDRKPFVKRDDDKRSFVKRDDDRKPFVKRDDDKRSFVKRDDDRKPYGKRSDDRKPFNGRNHGEKPFVKREDDEKSFEKRSSERKPFERRSEDKRNFDSRTKDKRAADYGKSNNRPFEKRAPKKQFTEQLEIVEEAPKTEYEAPKDTIRLNKYVANSGVSSRRKADELIKQGFVKVNGEVIKEMGHRVKTTDIIEFKDDVIEIQTKMVYFLLNKPKNVITTVSDDKDRKTVMDIMQNVCEERIYPVGRLDRNTTGLLLLTNDGDLAKKLSHPSYDVKKIYHVILDKPLEEADFEKIKAGLELEDGLAPVDKLDYEEGDRARKGLVITIHIGRNRIVRRIFAHLGYSVEKLDRIYYGGLTKKNLSRGFSRPLNKQEVIMLKHFI
jgi:23S rRNA pseudouridine2605 synthase